MVNDKLEIINPPNNLKKKVCTGGTGAVDLKALERAEQIITDMTDSYLDWVAEDLKKIGQAYAKLEVAKGDQKEGMEAVSKFPTTSRARASTRTLPSTWARSRARICARSSSAGCASWASS